MIPIFYPFFINSNSNIDIPMNTLIVLGGSILLISIIIMFVSAACFFISIAFDGDVIIDICMKCMLFFFGILILSLIIIVIGVLIG